MPVLGQLELHKETESQQMNTNKWKVSIQRIESKDGVLVTSFGKSVFMHFSWGNKMAHRGPDTPSTFCSFCQMSLVN